MTRMLILPVLVVLACLLAGIYGMVHNQISYTVGPDYFHAFKFHQFNIAETLPYRLGAAIVGWRASWWMGLVIGAPIACVTLWAGTARAQAAIFLHSALWVVLVTFGLGLASLLIPLRPEVMELIQIPEAASDPQGFARAALMHDSSYLAGLIGLLIGLILAVRGVRQSRF